MWSRSTWTLHERILTRVIYSFLLLSLRFQKTINWVIEDLNILNILKQTLHNYQNILNKYFLVIVKIEFAIKISKTRIMKNCYLGTSVMFSMFNYATTQGCVIRRERVKIDYFFPVNKRQYGYIKRWTSLSEKRIRNLGKKYSCVEGILA